MSEHIVVWSHQYDELMLSENFHAHTSIIDVNFWDIFFLFAKAAISWDINYDFYFLNSQGNYLHATPFFYKIVTMPHSNHPLNFNHIFVTKLKAT